MDSETLELIDWLKQQKWSDYARKVLIHYDKNKSLTEVQISTAKRMRENRERGRTETAE